MPFTFAHPAAVLPIKRLWPSASLPALAIGSMSPDFAYFYKLGVPGSFSHSPWGIFLFCVPAGLVAYVLYYLVVRGPVLMLLPGFFRFRLEYQSSPSSLSTAWVPQGGKELVTLLASFAVGAATHLLWDSFTHGNTPAVQYFPWLAQSIAFPDAVRLPLYNVLQHASSLGGLAIMAAWAGRRLLGMPLYQFQPQPDPMEGSSMHRTVVLILLGFVAIAGLSSGLLDAAGVSLERTLFVGIVRSIRYLTAALLIYAIAMQARSLWRERNLLT
jgi:hypothetical protein